LPGKCGADPLLDEEHDQEQAPDAHANGTPNLHEGAPVPESTCEPLWKLEQPAQSPLKVLQVWTHTLWRVLPVCWHARWPDRARVQVLQLVAEYRERHQLTLPAFSDLLTLLQAVMPANMFPTTVYRFRKVSHAVLKETLGGTGFQRIHLCSDMQCTHLYENEARECPVCAKPRYERLQNGREKAIRELRYMGLEQGVRVLLMSRKVSRAINNFDLASMVDSTYSVYSSRLSEHLCNYFIPGYSLMGPVEARKVKIRFFDSGQVCTDAEWDQYVAEVRAGARRRSKLLMVEGGCDGFQPFNRRVWSTWLFGYRLTCVNWYEGCASQFEIVTAISEGACEGKAAQVAASLDAQQLIQLRPPSAIERMHGLGGIQVPQVLKGVHMWGSNGGEDVLEKVDVWVICCGIQADAPMRQLLTRSLGHAAERGCDCCGIVAKKGVWNANKYLGYEASIPRLSG
jgi:hypothetical protein